MACSVAASLIFSFSALFVKMTGGRVPALEVTAARSVLSFLITLLLALRKVRALLAEVLPGHAAVPVHQGCC